MHYYVWDASSEFGSFGFFENRFRLFQKKVWATLIYNIK